MLLPLGCTAPTKTRTNTVQQLAGWLHDLPACHARHACPAVERLEEYSKVPQEAAPVVPGSVPSGWPEKGEVRQQGTLQGGCR